MKLSEIVTIDEKIMKKFGITQGTEIRQITPYLWYAEESDYDWVDWLVSPSATHQAIEILLYNGTEITYNIEGLPTLIIQGIETEEQYEKDGLVVFQLSMEELLNKGKNKEILNLSKIKKKAA